MITLIIISTDTLKMEVPCKVYLSAQLQQLL